MSEVSADELRKAVEAMHGCHATLREVVPVRETFHGKIVWEGVVHVFGVDLSNCEVCYAWSGIVKESERRKFYAVLNTPPIKSPIDAIRAAIASETK